MRGDLRFGIFLIACFPKFTSCASCAAFIRSCESQIDSPCHEYYGKENYYSDNNVLYHYGSFLLNL